MESDVVDVPDAFLAHPGAPELMGVQDVAVVRPGRPPILVIEDNPGIKDLLSDVLTAGGYEVVALESALGAAEVIRRIRPSAIVLDLGLPYRSGGSLLGELKADTETARIPVIVVSALPDTLTSERRAMATAVLRKPLKPDALLSALRKSIGGA